MNRTPPTEIRRQLRQEVGFGCPVCGSPYLEWHHFNPPWSQKHHHNLEGMIALCSEHHKKADAGAYTIEQLINLKRTANNNEISGNFDWLRNDILALVGGNFYYKTPIIFEYKNQPMIWFNRDENGYLLLNIKMLTTSGEKRAEIIDNFWIEKGKPIDLISPPNGKELSVRYKNGDYIYISYSEYKTAEDLNTKYPNNSVNNINYPITIVEINYNVANTMINFTPASTQISGVNLRNCYMADCKVAISLQ